MTGAKGAGNVRAFVRRDVEGDVGCDGVVPATAVTASLAPW